MKKAVVLSSGGLDSTVCLGLAVSEFGRENVIAINVFYGQRHAKELESSKKVCEYYGVPRIELDLLPCFEGGKSSLMKWSTSEISSGTYHEQLSNGQLATVVPFRNGVFLSAAVSLILGQFPEDEITVVLGNHAGDYENHEYADCSGEFIESMGKAIKLGTDGRASVYSPFVNSKKYEIVKKGIELHVPFELTWSCYNGLEYPCGKCATCKQRSEAFRLAGIPDPLLAKN